MELSKVEKKSVTQEIIAQIVERIANGDWKPGDKLPPEAELVEAFGASKYSVRSALSQLNTMGLLITEQGKGTYVRDSSQPQLLQPLLTTGMQSAHKLMTILEFRRGVEPEAARMAALRRTPEEVQELERILRKMEAASRRHDQRDYSRYDIRFHVKLAEMSGNSWFLQSMRIVESLYMADLENATKRDEFAAHEEVFDAVAAGDPERAYARMRRHLMRTAEILEEMMKAGQTG